MLHTDPDFGLIKQNRAFIRKFSGSQIQVEHCLFLKFIFFRFTAGGRGTEAKSPRGKISETFQWCYFIPCLQKFFLD
jgi:hypothetical protein